MVIQAQTLVYSIRIRRGFAPTAQIQEQSKRHWIVSAVPIVSGFNFKIFEGFENHLYTGVVAGVRYAPTRQVWFEGVTAVAHEQVKFDNLRGQGHRSRNGLDDIVLSMGFNFFQNKPGQVIAYVLGGIPTRLKFNSSEFNQALVGTRFFSFGSGAEFSYAFVDSLKYSIRPLRKLIIATRNYEFQQLN